MHLYYFIFFSTQTRYSVYHHHISTSTHSNNTITRDQEFNVRHRNVFTLARLYLYFYYYNTSTTTTSITTTKHYFSALFYFNLFQTVLLLHACTQFDVSSPSLFIVFNKKYSYTYTSSPSFRSCLTVSREIHTEVHAHVQVSACKCKCKCK